jgi:predicted MFS family arabinose efflux permease
MIGPAVGVLIATGVSTRAALLAVAVATLVVGLALIAVNPPTRSAEPEASPYAEGSPDPEGSLDVEG